MEPNREPEGCASLPGGIKRGFWRIPSKLLSWTLAPRDGVPSGLRKALPPKHHREIVQGGHPLLNPHTDLSASISFRVLCGDHSYHPCTSIYLSYPNYNLFFWEAILFGVEGADFHYWFVLFPMLASSQITNQKTIPTFQVEHNDNTNFFNPNLLLFY